MQRAFLCRPVAFTGLSASASTAAAPVANLGNDRMGRVWKPGSGSGTVTATFASQLIDTVALVGTNADSDSSWSVSGLGV